MNRIVSTLASLIIFAAPPAGAAGLAIVGVDISASAPLTADPVVAGNAATWLGEQISAMSPGDRLRIVSVGRAGIADRAIDLRATLGNRTRDRPPVVARQVRDYIAGLPRMAASGQLASQDMTSLVDFLEGLAGHDCNATPTRIILFTDGVESSVRINDRDLAAGKISLPRPNTPFLKGCVVELRGVGQLRAGGGSDGLYARLKPVWQTYLEAAGASEIVITREMGGF